MSGINSNLYATGPFPSFEAQNPVEEPIQEASGAFDNEAFQEGLANSQISIERIEEILTALESLRANNPDWNADYTYEEVEENAPEEDLNSSHITLDVSFIEGAPIFSEERMEENTFGMADEPTEEPSLIEAEAVVDEALSAVAPLPLDAPITQAEIDDINAEIEALELEEPKPLVQNEPLPEPKAVVQEEAPAIPALFEPLGTWEASPYPDISSEYTRYVPENIRQQKREELTNLLGAELAARVVKEEPKAETSAQALVAKPSAQIVVQESEDEGEEILLFEGETSVSIEELPSPKLAPIVRLPREVSLMSFQPIASPLQSAAQQTAYKVAQSPVDLLTGFAPAIQAIPRHEPPKGPLYPNIERRVTPIQPPVQKAPETKNVNSLKSKSLEKISVNPFALDSYFSPLYAKMDQAMNQLAQNIHREIEAGRYPNFNPESPTMSLKPHLIEIARIARIDSRPGFRRKTNYMQPLPLRYTQQPVQRASTPTVETEVVVNAVFREVVARYYREYKV